MRFFKRLSSEKLASPNSKTINNNKKVKNHKEKVVACSLPAKIHDDDNGDAKCNNNTIVTAKSASCTNIAQQLEGIIGVVKSQQSVIDTGRHLVDPDDFFTEPEEVQQYQEKQLVAEWIIVEKDNVNDTTTCLYENGQHSLAIVKGTALVTPYDREAFVNSLMGPLLEPSEVFQISHNSAKKLIRQKEVFCLEKHFGLNDNGGILIHLDHIIVHEGCVEVATKVHYKGRITLGKEILENYKVKISFEQALLKFLRCLFRKSGNIGLSVYLSYIMYYSSI